MLTQDLEPVEVIIVDDGSESEKLTGRWLRGSEGIVGSGFSRAPIGVCVARNSALRV